MILIHYSRFKETFKSVTASVKITNEYYNFEGDSMIKVFNRYHLKHGLLYRVCDYLLYQYYHSKQELSEYGFESHRKAIARLPF